MPKQKAKSTEATKSVYIKDARRVLCWHGTRQVNKEVNYQPSGAILVSNPNPHHCAPAKVWVKKPLRKKWVTVKEKYTQRFKYPRNYHEIVEAGKIKENKDSSGHFTHDDDGNPEYTLVYDRHIYPLDLVLDLNDRLYLTLKHNSPDNFYKPFRFNSGLGKRLPIFEAEKTQDPDYPLKLTNTTLLFKKKRNAEGKKELVLDRKARNNQLLYMSHYENQNANFWVIRDDAFNVEYDKTILFLPVSLAAGSAKVCANMLSYLPYESGKFLITRQNILLKLAGYPLFLPGMLVKNSVSLTATLLKTPILLFTAREKKYADRYSTLWKYQWKKYWQKTKNDFSLVKNGKKVEAQAKNYPSFTIVGTWSELAVMTTDFKKLLEEFGSVVHHHHDTEF